MSILSHFDLDNLFTKFLIILFCIKLFNDELEIRWTKISLAQNKFGNWIRFLNVIVGIAIIFRSKEWVLCFYYNSIFSVHRSKVICMTDPNFLLLVNILAWLEIFRILTNLVIYLGVKALKATNWLTNALWPGIWIISPNNNNFDTEWPNQLCRNCLQRRAEYNSVSLDPLSHRRDRLSEQKYSSGQINAYQILYWFNYWLRRTKSTEDVQLVSFM